MRAWFYQFIPHLILIISVGASVACISYIKWQERKSRKVTPLTQDLLRLPGETLRERIDDISLDAITTYFAITITPILFYSVYLSSSGLGKLHTPLKIIIFLLAATAILTYLIRKLIFQLTVKRKLSLGLDAENAVGQELNYLMHAGYWVYHDFPADGFNIDHVVIGSNGIFAVETKGRTKTEGRGRSEVTFNGKELIFPSWQESEPINQALRQADWLAKWLTREVGESMDVQPILALPGWFVKNNS